MLLQSLTKHFGRLLCLHITIESNLLLCVAHLAAKLLFSAEHLSFVLLSDTSLSILCLTLLASDYVFEIEDSIILCKEFVFDAVLLLQKSRSQLQICAFELCVELRNLTLALTDSDSLLCKFALILLLAV